MSITKIIHRSQLTNHDTLFMWCPGCDDIHQVWVSGEYRWEWDGNEDKPTISPSILVQYGKRPGANGGWVEKICHSYVRDGQWQFLGDSTHALAGQTVGMVSIPEDFEGLE